MNRSAARFVFILAAALACGLALAQSIPSRPMTIIVPYAAGGQVDTMARLAGSALSESLGQPVVVDNRPGGSSIIGMQACAKAAPDGHTMCFTVPDSLSYNPAMFSDLPYKPETDFAPVINLGWVNVLIVANAKAPFNGYKEMIAYARANPGKLNWATWGAASLPDLYLQWIRRQLGVDIVAIGDRRSRFMPDLPTLSEEGGDPGLRAYFAAFAPGATPRPIVERLNAELTKALHTPKLQAFLTAATLDFVENSPAEFAEFVKRDRENAARVFRRIGITPTASPQS